MTTAGGIVTALVVLYERTPAESEALTSLERILAVQPVLKSRFRLLVYDNSPVASEVEDGFDYVHDAANRGLAAAYNYALAQAREGASEWLLLLDQDTTLTAEYVSELLEEVDVQTGNAGVAAIVPILELNGRVYSPEADYFYHLRHQFRYMRYYPVARDTAGVQRKPLNAYNSGAVLRVSALEKIGGFPVDFQLDYLDHATFFELHRHGFSIYILRSALQQKLSHDDLEKVSLARHTSVLQSQSLFVARYGTLLDRLLYRLWLLRRSRDYRALCSDPRVWKGMVRQALGVWKLPPQVRSR